MRTRLTYFVLSFLVLIMNIGVSRAYNDSLTDVLLGAGNDTQRIELLMELAKKQLNSYPTVALDYIEQANELSKRIGYQEGLALSLTQMGTSYWYQGNYDQALKYYLESLLLNEELFRNAVKNNDSLGVHKFKNGMAGSNMGLGIVYIYLGDYNKTLEYYKKAQAIYEEVNDLEEVAACLTNIGSVYYRKQDYGKALIYYNKSLLINEEFGNQKNIADNLSGISIVHYYLGDIDKSIEIDLKSLDIYRALGDKHGIARLLNNIAETYSSTGDYDNAVSYSMQSLEVAENISAKKDMKNAYQHLAESYELKRDFKNAYRYVKLFSTTKDSLFNEDKSKEIGKLEMKYEMQKQMEEEKRLKEAVAKEERDNKSRRDNLQYSGILISLVFLGAILLMLGRFRIPVRLAEGLIFFTFLLLFEFLLVLLDPWIETHSSGAPAAKLAFNAVLAGMIFPLHSFFESTLKNRLVKHALSTSTDHV